MPTNYNRTTLFVLFHSAVVFAAITLIVNISCSFSMECVTEFGNHIGPKLCILLSILIILRRVDITIRQERWEDRLLNKLKPFIESIKSRS